MKSEKETSLIDEVGSRFDSIFSQEDDLRPRESVGENLTEKVLHSPLRNIKSVVLSMDWEITDQTLLTFGQEIDALKKVYRENGVSLQFLKILQVLGNYIRKHLAEAHPTSFKLLHTVFNRFERVSIAEDMPMAEQHHLLKQSIADFTELKSIITDKKIQAPPLPKPRTEESEKPVTKAAEKPADQYNGLAPHEAFALAVEEIKNLIKSEFQILRTELRMWRDGQ